MIYLKMTHGWVAQRYDSETGECIGQQFVADPEEQPIREQEDGTIIEDDEMLTEMANTEKECPMDMVQP